MIEGLGGRTRAGGEVKPKSEHDDKSELPLEGWLEAARAGEKEPLGAALEAYRPYLVKIASDELGSELRPKEGVSDIVQNTFVEAMKDFDGFTGQTRVEWKAWLRTIFVNNLRQVVRTYRRVAKRAISREVSFEQVKAADREEASLIEFDSSPSSRMIKSEMIEALQQALGRLPEREHLVLSMRFRDQATYEQIGRRLGCSTVAARNAWIKAMDRVRLEVNTRSRSH